MRVEMCIETTICLMLCVESETVFFVLQLDQFQVSHMSRLYNQRAAALSNYQNEYYNQRNIYTMMPQVHNPPPY